MNIALHHHIPTQNSLGYKLDRNSGSTWERNDCTTIYKYSQIKKKLPLKWVSVEISYENEVIYPGAFLIFRGAQTTVCYINPTPCFAVVLSLPRQSFCRPLCLNHSLLSREILLLLLRTACYK